MNTAARPFWISAKSKTKVDCMRVWRNLLAGAGVPSVERALQEMLLQPVLAPFRKVCDADLWAQVLGISPRTVEITIEVADEELSGAKTVKAPVATKTRRVAPDAEALETLEARWLTAVRAMKKFAKSEADEASLLIELRSRLERAIASNAPDAMRAQLLAYALVADVAALGETSSGAQAREWFDNWLLGESLAAPLRELGAKPQAVDEIGWWLAHLPDSGQTEPFALLMQLLADDSAKNLLRVNRFEGTLWFNAEGWQTLHGALKRGAQFESVELPLLALDAAATASGYRVVNWMEATRNPASATTENGDTPAQSPKGTRKSAPKL